MVNLIAKQLDQQATRVIPPYPSGGFMRSSEKFVLSAILGVTLIGCATDSAIGPNDDLRPSLAVTIDLDAGTGFVGKGDVQTFFGWNNKGLQDAADGISFRYAAETSWTCSKPNPSGQGQPDIVQERNTSVTAISTVIGRENSQGVNGPWSGFVLTFGSTSTDGPEVGTCPADQSGFVYDNNASVGAGGLQIMTTATPANGKLAGTWYDFP